MKPICPFRTLMDSSRNTPRLGYNVNISIMESNFWTRLRNQFFLLSCLYPVDSVFNVFKIGKNINNLKLNKLTIFLTNEQFHHTYGKKRYSKSCKGGMMASTTAQATALGLLGLNLLAASPKRTRNIRRKYRSSRKRR